MWDGNVPASSSAVASVAGLGSFEVCQSRNLTSSHHCHTNIPPCSYTQHTINYIGLTASRLCHFTVPIYTTLYCCITMLHRIHTVRIQSIACF